MILKAGELIILKALAYSNGHEAIGDKLATLNAGYPARITNVGINRLELYNDNEREGLAQEIDYLSAGVQELAERYGVGDPYAAHPGELLHELHDATHRPGEPEINETRALGLSS